MMMALDGFIATAQIHIEKTGIKTEFFPEQARQK